MATEKRMETQEEIEALEEAKALAKQVAERFGVRFKAELRKALIKQGLLPQQKNLRNGTTQVENESADSPNE